MGNGHASRIAETPGIETNQGETASPPPIVRCNTRTEYLEFPTENRRIDNAVTERPSL